jgi:hypothetical protein
MSTDNITPGSIKARILEAIMELEERATTAVIKRRHPSNEAAVNTGVDQLFAGGFIQANEEGVWELTAAAKKVIRGQTITQALVAIRTNGAEKRSAAEQVTRPAPPINSGEVATGEVKKLCNACNQPKHAIKDFYPGNPTCRECRNDQARKAREEKQREREARNARMMPALRVSEPPADSGVSQIQQSPPDQTPVLQPQSPPTCAIEAANRIDPESTFPPEFIIPAEGTITCRAVAGSLWIHQDDKKVVVKHRQLVALVQWLADQQATLRAMGALP